MSDTSPEANTPEALEAKRAVWHKSVANISTTFNGFQPNQITVPWLETQIKKLERYQRNHDTAVEKLLVACADDNEAIPVVLKTAQDFDILSNDLLVKMRTKTEDLHSANARIPKYVDRAALTQQLLATQVELDTLLTSANRHERTPLTLVIAVLNELHELVERHNDIYLQLAMNLPAGEAKTEVTNHHVKFTSDSSDLRVRLENLRPQYRPENNGNGNNGNGSAPLTVHLPKTELPKFTGSEDDWPQFRDLFESLVHNNERITTIQKFSILVDCYKPAKNNVLKQYKVSVENYENAWKAVKDRHDDLDVRRQHCFHSILNIKSMNSDSESELHRLQDEFSVSIQNVKNLNVTIDDFLVYMIESRLTSSAHLEYKKSLGEAQPNTQYALKFLHEHAKAVKRSSVQKPKSSSTHSGESKPKPKVFVSSGGCDNCPLCRDEHLLHSCSQFIGMSRNSRFEFVKKRKLCVNCLASSHDVKACTSKYRCRKCEQMGKSNSKHHTLLHIPFEDKSSSQRPDSKTTPAPQSNFVPAPQSLSLQSLPHNTYVNLQQPIDFRINQPQGRTFVCRTLTTVGGNQICNMTRRRTLLSTASICMIARNGTRYACRALLDSGSDCNFVTLELANALDLPMNDIHLPVEGLGGKISIIKHSMDAGLNSFYGEFRADITFLVVPNITGNIPMKPLNKDELGIPSTLFLADPEFHAPKKCDILLGGELFMYSIMSGKMHLDSGVIMLETLFGWVVGGLAPQNYHARTLLSASSFVTSALDEDIKQMLEQFIANENIGISSSSSNKSPDEKHCEHLYQQTTSQQADGRYVVRLPFKPNIKQLCSNYKNAYRQLMILDSRRKSNPEFSSRYEDYMETMIQFGFMTEIDPSEKDIGYYLPHHGVTKTSSTTTKVRPVFNGSSKSESGLSLNECLYVGPTVQPEAFDILLRFRENPEAVVCDFEKMYLQVFVDDDDRKYQKILWHKDMNSPVRHYVLNSVTFGLACAPYLATRTVNRISDDNREKFPEAALKAKTSFYVDDGIMSCANSEEAKNVVDGILSMFSSSKLKARKWASNNPAILSNVSQDDIEKPNSDGNIGILGHNWNPTSDRISLNIKFPDRGIITKGSVLSTIASFYDLLGLFGPVILKAKLFLKQLTELKVNWLDELSEEFQHEWMSFCEELKQINSLSIPRYMIIASAKIIELHGFCDASEKGFGCVIYLRSIDGGGNIQVTLATSKSRVAPSKQQTLARLELCSAVLVSKIAHRASTVFSIPINQVVLWNDSMIALHWIHNAPSRYHTYVANRIAAIQDLTQSFKWRHVSGKDNPADFISRGLTPSEIVNCQAWWTSAWFLHHPESEWPTSHFNVDENNDPEVAKEVRRTLTIRHVSDLFEFIENRFSRFLVLRNTFVNLLRWKKIVASSRQGIPRCPSVTVEDNREAQMSIIRILQQTLYPDEYQLLKNSDQPSHQILPKQSSLLGLAIFMDEEFGIIRVGGRIKNCITITYDQRHPVLVPECKFLYVLLRHLHAIYHHPTLLSMKSFVRQQFWPIRIGQHVKKITRECIKCFREKAKPVTQYEADLPHARINITRPFERTAVDFAGPFNLRASLTKRASIVKAWIAVFRCMTTGAIHLELVSSLNTESFIMAFDRFTSRRGMCYEMYSDNGTNFTSADKEFKAAFKKHQPIIEDFLRDKEIKWNFTTPLASHAGGVYEIIVKMVKHCLYRSLENTSYDFEKFCTLLHKIEADLNSRPISPMSDDPNELRALTPGHFLIGGPMNSRPERNLLDVKDNLLLAWQRVDKVRQKFWQEYHHDYLHNLQQRPKNASLSHEFRVGQMVIIYEPNTPPRKWRLGRIVQVYPGKDGVIRNVRVKTATREYDRHVNRMVLLPIQDNEVNSSPPAQGDAVASIVN